MELYYLSKEQISDVGCIISFMTSYEMCHLRKPINNHKIESLPFLDLGKPKTKSIEILTQGALGTGRGVYNPCGKTLDLACLQVMHLAQALSISRFIFGQKKCSCNTSKVFLTPK